MQLAKRGIFLKTTMPTVPDVLNWPRWRWVISVCACALLVACGGGNSANNAAADTDDGLVAGLLAAPITEAQAVRFLWKSSFGPTTDSIARLRQLGYARFVDEQLNLPANRYNTYLLGDFGGYSNDAVAVDNYCRQQPIEVYPYCAYWVYYEPKAPSVVFLKSAVHDSDQLRLRVAFALSQILVISQNFSGRVSYGMRIYQQMLRDHALGNYREILLRMAKNPYMGVWLNNALNHKQAPNQNFARELLQLFSTGTYLLNEDGTFRRNAKGDLIENYTTKDIAELARAMTGWVYFNDPRFGTLAPTYTNDMVPDESRHDHNAKQLLSGQSLPAGRSAQQDLDAVIDNVFNHPSTPPYIVKQLIQFLVTSNPSPAYVKRVVNVFKRNTQGVRGDMKSVIRAILLDSEALNAPDNAGRLLEPVMVMTGIVRSVGGQTDGGFLDEAAAAMLQRPFVAPSVFNFYSPEFGLPKPGSQLKAPQFGIATTSSLTQRLNYLNQLIFADAIGPDPTLPKGYTTGSRLNWPSQWIALAGSQPTQLVDVLNTRLTGGVLVASQRALISSHVQSLPNNNESERLHRLRMAAFLVFASPQFMTHR